ncbi:hypothetical protein ABPG72_021313 [Tetrahymena utriculariae]
MLTDQGVEFIYQNQTFYLNAPNDRYITFYLENVILKDTFNISNISANIFFNELILRDVVIDINENQLFYLYQIECFVINKLKFENLTSPIPLFRALNILAFEFQSGHIINSNLYQGFGKFINVSDIGINNKFVDINTLQNLNETFYELTNNNIIHMFNCTFGNYQNPYQELKAIKNQKFSNYEDHIFQNQSYVRSNNNGKNKFLNFIQIKKFNNNDNYLVNIQADFENLNMRFMVIMDTNGICIRIIDSQFKNMKSIDSGGCIGNLGQNLLQFSNTSFDSCQSGMFGGAIYSFGLNVTDELIIKNSRSKIGGGIFISSEQARVHGLDKINYINDSNTATISSQQYFKCTEQPYGSKLNSCNLFELDSIYELNNELVNTQYYQVQKEVKINENGTAPHIYVSTLYQSHIYIIRLKVEYNCPEKQLPYLCSVREFNEDQSIGNLYNYIHKDYQQYFYNFDIPNVNYPYVLTSYNEKNDCQYGQGWTYIFIIFLFPVETYYSYNSRNGCFYLSNICETGMQQILNQQLQTVCKYCDIGSYSDSDSPGVNCEICNIDKFDKCYVKDSYVKKNFWRPQNSKYNDIYFCQLNQQSCNGEKRSGYGNDLCSEGYVGAQCITCDIKGQFWNEESYGQQGYFQCVKCSSLNNNDTFVFLSLTAIIFVFFFTIISSFIRMRKQIYRRYLSFYMKKIYIGSSFIRQSQASVYTKILIFNFQMYLLTYYFVDFDKYDSSIHSTIYNFFNPLQNSGGISYDCFLLQYFPTSESLGFIKLLISIISPLILNSFFWLIIAIYSYLRKKRYPFLLINSFVFSVIFVFQSQIIQYCVESITCIKLSSNDEYLMIDTHINCKDEYWMSSMKYLSIPSLIIYIFVIPIILFGYIFVNRKKLEKSRIHITFGFMYDEYKREYFYWQFIKLMLTTFLSALVSIGKTHIVLCCLTYSAILCIYYVSIIYFKPFQQISMNKVELISIVLSVLYFLSSICLQLEFNEENYYDQYKIGRIMSEIFYYLVLTCQFIFYLYVIGLIIVSVSYISIQKLIKFRFFQSFVRLFPRAQSKINSRNLLINLQKLRQVVKCIMIDQNINLLNGQIENSLNKGNDTNQE